MSLTLRQRRRVAWLIDGHLAADVDPDTPEFTARWERQFAAISSPEELFLYVSESHPAQQPHEWRQLLANPLCDHGTALLIFWRNSPVYLYWNEPPGGWDRERYDLVREIALKYVAGGYRSAVVRFDPSAFKSIDFLRGYSAEELTRVPAEMCRPSPGQPVLPLNAADFDWSGEAF